MRIQFVIPMPLNADDIVGGFAKGLQAVLCKDFGVEIVNEHPDLIHVFGAWHNASAKAIETAHERRIPVVYSPLGGLTPWQIDKHELQILRYQRQATRKADILHVAGPQEQACVQKWAEKQQKIILLHNPILTATTSFETVGKAFFEEYTQLIENKDHYIRENIQLRIKNMKETDAVIRQICFQTLYLQYWYQRGTIPCALLKELSAYMIANDYDEDDMPAALQELDITKFFCRLEQLMGSVAQLTEGYMPIDPIDDATTKAMASLCFNNE